MPLDDEVLTLLREHTRQSEERDRRQTEKSTEILTLVKHQGSQILQLHTAVAEAKRVAEKASLDATKALDAQADLESGVLKEFSSLHKNDEQQNGKLEELLDDKKAIVANIKLAKWALVAAPGLWMFLQWALTHIKF